MAIPAVAVLGATGRIGRLLQFHLPAHASGGPAQGGPALRLQARRGPAEDLPGFAPRLAPSPAASASSPHRWHVFDPLGERDALARFATGAQVLLCLAGPVPGRRTAGCAQDMQDHIRLGCAAVEAAAQAGAQAEAGVRVLLASSAAVYGAGQGLLHEDSPLAPASAYGAAKAEMERCAQARAAELGVALTCLRIGNVAGFDAILGGWRPGFRLDRFADGRSPRRSYIGVQSLAQVLSALLRLPALPTALPPVLNLAQPGPVEMAELLRAAGRAFDWQDAPAGAIPEVLLDTRRLQALLPAPPGLADPVQMVAQWAATEPHFNKEQSRR